MATQACPLACSSTRFELRKIRSTSKIPDVVTHFVNLPMDKLSDDLLIAPVEASVNFIPKFLNDKNPGTFSFSLLNFDALESQKGKKMIQMLQIEQKNFKTRTQQALKQCQSLIDCHQEQGQNVPLPIPKSIFCHICNLYMSQDYLNHIQQAKHKKTLKSRKANRYINDLCQKYQKKTKKLETSKKNENPTVRKSKRIAKEGKKQKVSNIYGLNEESKTKISFDKMGIFPAFSLIAQSGGL